MGWIILIVIGIVLVFVLIGKKEDKKNIKNRAWIEEDVKRCNTERLEREKEEEYKNSNEYKTMEEIDDFLAETFLDNFYGTEKAKMDNNPEFKISINELKSNAELITKSSHELITRIYIEIAVICRTEKYKMQDAIIMMLQAAYIYSHAYETKMGDISKVFMSLVDTHNKVQQRK
ncbi:MAG: hypothetical protein KAR57_06555 [Bacteroidales bacterium]|nr:hypothetical protein [Bacteroidales bacterium]